MLSNHHITQLNIPFEETWIPLCPPLHVGRRPSVARCPAAAIVGEGVK